MGGFPDRWMQELLSKTDIVSLVSEYVHLREKGGRMWGLCPFHNEKTASFSVSPDRQLYYCFGCHAGGNAVHFIVELEKLSYGEAVRLLAERVRLPMPEEADDEALRKEHDLKQKCYAACREAALYYHRMLAEPSSHAARAYLASRGVDAKSIKRFGLGYSGGSLIEYLKGQGFDEAVLLAAGLAVERGTLKNAFYDRVMFPIVGLRRSVVGFGARSLGQAQPKYLNSAENPIFNKRRYLYGMNFFRESGAKEIVLVEGYMDVVSLHQHGVTNSVASLGTALTQQQARIIKRNAPLAYIAYDSDQAGLNAALKAAATLMREGVEARVMRFTGGMDPDEFIRREGTLAFEELKDNAQTFAQFQLSMMASRHDLKDENGREAYAKEACAFIATLEPLSRERYYATLSRETGYSIEALSSQGKAESGAGYANIQDNYENSFPIIRNTRIARNTGENPERDRIERLILCTLVSSKECADDYADSKDGGVFENEAYAAFAAECVKFHFENPEKELSGSLLAALLDALPHEQAKLISGALDLQKPENPLEVMRDCIRLLKRLGLKERIQALQKQRDSCSDKEEKNRLAREFMALEAELREV